MFEDKGESTPSSGTHEKVSNFLSRKQVNALILLFILAIAVYFVATSGIVNNVKNDAEGFLQSMTASGLAIEQIDREDYVARELEGWTGEEINTKFSPGEIPETLKVSGFQNLYVTGITKGGPRGLDLRFEIQNLGEELVTFNGVEAVISVEFVNNPGVVNEYTVELIPQEEQVVMRSYASRSAGANIKTHPELYGKFIENYEVVKIIFR